LWHTLHPKRLTSKRAELAFFLPTSFAFSSARINKSDFTFP
jgi:hypothetical protein